MEDSTRTKESFRNAAEFHGLKVNVFDAKTSSFQTPVGKGFAREIGSGAQLYACVIWFVQPIESTCPTILADALGRWDIVTCLRIDMFAIDLDTLIDIKLVGAI